MGVVQFTDADIKREQETSVMVQTLLCKGVFRGQKVVVRDDGIVYLATKDGGRIILLAVYRDLAFKEAHDSGHTCRTETEAAGEHVDSGHGDDVESKEKGDDVEDEEHRDDVENEGRENDVGHEAVNRLGDGHPYENSQPPELAVSRSSAAPNPLPLQGPAGAAVQGDAETVARQKTIRPGVGKRGRVPDSIDEDVSEDDGQVQLRRTKSSRPTRPSPESRTTRIRRTSLQVTDGIATRTRVQLRLAPYPLADPFDDLGGRTRSPERARAKGHALQSDNDGCVATSDGERAGELDDVCVPTNEREREVELIDGSVPVEGDTTIPRAGTTEQEEEHIYVFDDRG
ncbi:hypothetical protein PC128_g24494 [Phytophthora cactorum]|nr:hypothetical protein PC128_g24494 [Phytophthora cactorum]